MNSTCFTKTSVLETGGFDSRFFISGDKEFIVRYVEQNPRIEVLKNFGMFVRSHSGSKTFAKKKQFDETMIAEGLIIADRCKHSDNGKIRKFGKRLKGKRLVMRCSNRLKSGDLFSVLKVRVGNWEELWLALREILGFFSSKSWKILMCPLDYWFYREIFAKAEKDVLWITTSVRKAPVNKTRQVSRSG
jgi:hypothetical protein